MSEDRLLKRRAILMGSTATALAGAVLSVPFAAQAQQEDADEIEQIVVTGSRIARTDLTSSSPVAVVDAEQFRLSGTVNVEQLLNTLPQVIPGFTAFSNNPGNGAATVDLRGLGSTRTLVLVNGRRHMFFDANQISDINTIPSALIERTEVVTGGASAVYGSDAIGGVVNFIMKDDFEGIEISSQYDITTRGDGDRANVDLTIGGNFDDGKGNAVLYFNYFDRDPVFQDARAFSTDALVDDEDENGNPALVPGGSASVPNGRFASFPLGEALEARPALQDAMRAAGIDPDTLTAFGIIANPQGGARNFINPDDAFNYAPDNFLQIPQERWMVGGMSRYQIHDKVEAYVEGLFSNNRVDQELAPTPITGTFTFNTNNPFLSAAMRDVLTQLDQTEGSLVAEVVRDANGNPILDEDGNFQDLRDADGAIVFQRDPNTGLPIIAASSTARDPVTGNAIPGFASTANNGQVRLSIGRRLEEVGPRQNLDERNAWRVVAGLRGDLGDAGDGFLTNLNYDAYYLFARTLNTQRQFGNVSRSRFQQALLTNAAGTACTNTANGCAPLNIFGAGNISEDAANFIRISATNVEESQLQVASGVISGDLFELPAGPAGFAFGTEWRSVSGRFSPDFALSSGDVVGFNAGQPTQGSYNVWELFGEVRIPLVADMPFADRLELNGAFRYSDYSLDNVGGVWTYAGGIDWGVTKDLTFRAQFQRAIRAPNVEELFGGQSQGFPSADDPCAQPAAATNPVVRDLCIATGVPAGAVGTPGVQPNSQIQGLFGGNPDLKEESSDTYTIGAVFTPSAVPGLSVTVDYYNISIDDFITVLGGSLNNVLDLCFNTIQDINSQFCQAINRNADGTIAEPNFVEVLNANIAKLKTDGVDLQINYTMDLDFGMLSETSTLSFYVLGTWLNKYNFTPVAELPDAIDRCAGQFGNTCGEPLPEFKTNTRMTYRDGPLTASIRWRWLDSVKDDQILNGGVDPADLAAPSISSQHYFDLSATYDVTENLQIFGGIDNLFDNTPPLVGDSSEQANTFPGTYDVLGSKLFFGATVRF